MYPTEEIARRNRWQDEYDAATREHAWSQDDAPVLHVEFKDEVPAHIVAEFEDK